MRRQEARYLQFRVRRPASVWPIARLASACAVLALVATLLTRPETGLFIVWDLLVPVLPALFLVAPGLWRNVCPMAGANQLPRVLGLSLSRSLPRGLERHAFALAVASFLALVLARGPVFEKGATALAVLLLGALAVPFAAGVAFRGKSGFCGSLCPLSPVQGLYGQRPFVRVENSHCRPCVGCTTHCVDLEPTTAFHDELHEDDARRGGYRRVFAGAFPGFVLAFYLSPGSDALELAATAWHYGRFVLVSLGVFVVLDSLVGFAVERLVALFAAVAFAVFYWFNVPTLAAGVSRLTGVDPPAWAIWEARVLLAALSLAWLLRMWRRRTGTDAASRSEATPLPVASPSMGPPQDAVPAGAAGSASATAGAEPTGREVAAPQVPVAGSPAVQIPDRRSRDRRMTTARVTILPERRELEVVPGTTLLDATRREGLALEAGCRMGVCGSDPVYVLEGGENLSPRTDTERETSERSGLPGHARLACCARVQGDVTIALSGEARLSAADPGPEPEVEATPLAPIEAARPGEVSATRRSVPGCSTNVVIVGTGIAGVTAADHVRRADPDATIHLVGEEPHPLYNRIGISRLLHTRDGVSALYLMPDSWYREREIVSWLNTRITALDRSARHLLLGTGETLAFDRLILATGSRAIEPTIPGVGLEGSFVLRQADDAVRIRAFVQRTSCRRAVVIGGGVLGLEAADSLRELGLQVTVIERGPWLARNELDERGGALLRTQVERAGVHTRVGANVVALNGRERLASVSLDDGSDLLADVLVTCVGTTPNVELARAAGLVVKRGVQVDDAMRTSDPDIFAAGDVAEHRERVHGLWSAALEQAEVAAVNAVGGARTFTDTARPTVLKVRGVDLVSIGRVRSIPGDREHVRDEREGRYGKLVLEGERLVGAALIGFSTAAMSVAAAVRERREIGPHLDELARGDWRSLGAGAAREAGEPSERQQPAAA